MIGEVYIGNEKVMTIEPWEVEFDNTKGSDSMKHYISDEKLGGVEREYEEVDRAAEVGDLVTYVSSTSGRRDGFIREVEEVSTNGNVSFFGNPYVDPEDGEKVYGFSPLGYKVLGKTNIARIDGHRYKLEDRKAEVGEKIVFSESCPEADITAGVPYVVMDSKAEELMFYDDAEDDHYWTNPSPDFVVLTTVEDKRINTSISVDIPKEALDLMAELAGKVAELEERIDSNEKDVKTLAEDVAANDHAIDEINGRLGHIEADAERQDAFNRLIALDIARLERRR